MSPTLFDIYLDEIIAIGLKHNGRVAIGGRRIKFTRFSDNMVVAENAAKLNDMLNGLNKSCEYREMKFNQKKIKCTVLEGGFENIEVKIEIKAIEHKEKFKNLVVSLRKSLT